MSPDAYLEMAETEAEHWWFKGRRDVLLAVLRQLALPAGARVLEVGSGTGGNLPMLEQFGRVHGLEMDATARMLTERKTGGRFDIRAGRCPDDIPFQNQRFDMICFFDCLEHIADDTGSLEEIRKLLAPGGAIIVTVPAYQWLWSSHDVFLHHYRRYSRASLERCAHTAGYAVERITYFNTVLFPVAVAARWFDKMMRRSHSSGDAVPARVVNNLLYQILRAESHWVTGRSLPYGMSLLAVLKAE